MLELVRYTNLNPLRAGLVKDLKELDTYSYCGHSRLLGSIEDGWQAVDNVLLHFGQRLRAARREYMKYIHDGVAKGRKPELTGGGLVRSVSELGVLKSRRRMAAHLKGHERILVDSAFIAQVLEAAKEQFDRHYHSRSIRLTFDDLVKQVGNHFDLAVDEILNPSKQPIRVKARSVTAYFAIRHLEMTDTEVAERLQVSQSAISRAVGRGESIVVESELSLSIENNA